MSQDPVDLKKPPGSKAEKNRCRARRRRRATYEKNVSPLHHPLIMAAIEAHGIRFEDLAKSLSSSGAAIKKHVGNIAVQAISTTNPVIVENDERYFDRQPIEVGLSRKSEAVVPTVQYDFAKIWWRIMGTPAPQFVGERRLCSVCRRLSLQVFPSEDGEVFVRCAPCGTWKTLVEHVAGFSGGTSIEAVEDLERWGGFVQSPTADWKRWAAACRLAVRHFNEGVKAHYLHSLEPKNPRVFGEWSLMSANIAEGILAEFGRTRKFRGLVMVRMSRNIWGRPALMTFCGPEYWMDCSLRLSPDLFTVVGCHKSAKREWSDLVLCCSEESALKMEPIMPKESSGPALLLSDENRAAPIVTNTKVERSLVVMRDRRDYSRGAAFDVIPKTSGWVQDHRETLSEIPLIEAIADATLPETAIETVDQIVMNPSVSRETGIKLVRAICQRHGFDFREFAEKMAIATSPIALRIHGANYLRRNGHYLVYRSRGFHQISNFCCTIIRRHPQCWMELEIEGRRKTVKMSHDTFHSPGLLGKLSKLAARHGLPAPWLTEGHQKLSSIILAT